MDLKSDLNNLKELNHGLYIKYQEFYVILQSLNYPGVRPFESLKIAENIKKMENLKFKEPHSLPEYVQTIKDIQTMNEAATIIYKIYIDVNIIADIGSSFTEGEKLDEALSSVKKKYVNYVRNYRQTNILKYSEDFIKSEISEDFLLKILDYDDVYKLIPLVKYILKIVPMTSRIKLKIEDLKDSILSSCNDITKSDDITRTPNVVQRLMTYQGLVPGTPNLPLREIAKTYMQVDYSDSLSVFKTLSTGVIIIYKILSTAIDYHMWQLVNKNYVLKHNLNKPLTRGVDKAAIERFMTITQSANTLADDANTLADNANIKDQILLIKKMDYNFILETIDGKNFVILKERGSDTLLTHNVKFRPSIRVKGYNEILNEEITHHINKPYYDPTLKYSVENVDAHRIAIKNQIMSDFRDKTVETVKFFEEYNYANLLFKSVAHIIEKLPSEYILPYLNYEFLNLYAYDIEKFKNKIKKGILADLMQQLDHNERVIDQIVDKNIRKILLSDRSNLYNELSRRLELLVSLLS